MHPNFTGSWKADLPASKLLGPTPQDIAVVIAHSESALRVDMTVTTVDGATSCIVFDASLTEQATMNSVLGGEWITHAKWIGEELLIESRVNQSGRQMHLCDYWRLSSDGGRLTMEHRGDALDGQVTVLERVGGGK